MQRHTFIKAIKHTNKTFIQEIDATSSTNIIQHAFIKILNSRSGYKINIHPTDGQNLHNVIKSRES